MADSFQLKAIITAVDKLSPTLKNITRVTKGVHKSFRDIGNAGGELMRKIGLPAIAGFAATVFGVREATMAIFGYVGALQDAIDRTGLAANQQQAYRWGFEEGGVAVEGFDNSMIRLNKTLADAASGDKSLQGLFTAMRVPLRAANGQVRALGDVLPDVAESFKNTTNPAVRTRMAVALFGKEGAKLAPILAKGRAGLAEMVSEAARLGITINDGSVQSIDQLGDSVGRITSQLRGVWGNTLGEAAAVVEPLLLSLQEWIAANKDLIRSNLTQVIGDVSAWIKSVDWARVGADIRAIAAGVVWVVDALGGLRGVAILVGAAFVAGPLAALMSIGGALLRFIPMIASFVAWLAPLNYAAAIPVLLKIVAAVKAMGVAMLATPWGAVIAGIAMVAAIIYNNWDSIVAYVGGAWDRIKAVFEVDWFAGLFQLWLEGWQAFGNSILGIVRSILPSALIPDTLKDMRFSFATDMAATVAGGPVGARSVVTPAAAGAKSAVDLNVSFEGAPPGMRVSEAKGKAPGVSVNTDVGYRSMVGAF